jgi:hypothetical protein
MFVRSLVTLALLAQSSNALYTTGDGVVQLTEANFDKGKF